MQTPSSSSFTKSVLAIIGFVLSVTNPGHVVNFPPAVQAVAAGGCAFVVAGWVFAHQLAQLLHVDITTPPAATKAADTLHSLVAALDAHNAARAAVGAPPVQITGSSSAATTTAPPAAQPGQVTGA